MSIKKKRNPLLESESEQSYKWGETYNTRIHTKYMMQKWVIHSMIYIK